MKNKQSPLTEIKDTPLKLHIDGQKGHSLGEGHDIEGFVPNTGFNTNYTKNENAPYGYTEGGNIRLQGTIGESVRKVAGDPAYERILTNISKITGGTVSFDKVTNTPNPDNTSTETFKDVDSYLKSKTKSKKILTPGDGWQYQKVDEKTYKVKKVDSEDWITVTPNSPDSWGFTSIQGMFSGFGSQEPDWKMYGFSSDQEYLNYKKTFDGKEPWEQEGYGSKEEWIDANIQSF